MGTVLVTMPTALLAACAPSACADGNIHRNAPIAPSTTVRAKRVPAGR
jgi:hypothetical protein